MKIKIGTIFLRIVIAVVAFAVAGLSVYGQADKKKTKIATPFSWVSPASEWKAKRYRRMFGTTPLKARA
ncbi:MAG: hypothetical protein VCA18_01310 [Opitutales bacterium]